MPRSTKNSRASASTGDERDPPLVLSGEEDGVAPPPRIPPEVKERLRQMQQACTLSMYDHAVALVTKEGVFAPARPSACAASLPFIGSDLDKRDENRMLTRPNRRMCPGHKDCLLYTSPSPRD